MDDEDDEDSFLSTEKETHADGGKFGLAVGRPDSQFPNLNFDLFPWCRKLKTPQAPTNGCFAGAEMTGPKPKPQQRPPVADDGGRSVRGEEADFAAIR